MRFGPDCKRAAQNFRAGNPRELPKTVAKRQKVCYNHKKDCPRPFAGLWAAVLFGKSLKEKEENEAQSIEDEKPETEVIEACMTRREYMNTLTVAKMADYIAEEHHSGHLLASDLIFPEKIRQWLRDKVDRYGKAQS